MFCEKGLGEVRKVGNDFVLRVCPKGSELKAVACLSLALCVLRLFDMVVARGVGVIFRICAVGDDEDLHIVKEPVRRPKAVAGIAVDLIERFSDSDAAAFEFDMYEGQTVDENGDVVTVFADATRLGVLVDDL